MSPRSVPNADAASVVAPRIAVVHHHGSLANIDLTYGDLGGYVMKDELAVEGPLRENYLCGFLGTDDAENGRSRLGGRSFALTERSLAKTCKDRRKIARWLASWQTSPSKPG